MLQARHVGVTLQLVLGQILWFYRAVTGEMLQRLRGHGGECNVHWVRRRVGEDGVRVYDGKVSGGGNGNRQELAAQVLEGHDDEVTGIAVHSDGRTHILLFR